MLKQLSIRNFKSWSSIDIKLGHVTGLFGTNSSGKSSILQFLLLLKQTKNATDRGIVLDFGAPDQLVNLGSFRDVVNQHDENAKISWEILWSLPELVINDPSGRRKEVLTSGSEMRVESAVHLQGTSLVCDKLCYEFGGFKFFIEPENASSTVFKLNAQSATDFRFVRNQARAWSLPGPIKTHLFPDQAKTYFQNSDFLGLLEAEYELLMDDIYYLGPLREYPRREYPWSGTRPVDVGRRGERVVEAILAATGKGEQRNLGGRTRYKPFQQMIAYWLKELGLISSFEIEEIGSGANLYRTAVKKDEKGPSVLLTDVGFGVSQILPALVLLYYVPEGSTVIMEQPEIHLHPSVQSGLADAILTAAQTRNLQVIVESHSEHLLRRFQRRIAEGGCSPDFLSCFFCDVRDGKSKLTELEIDIFGHIKNWPENFFGDQMMEVAETQKAALKRQMSGSSA